jgi:protein transport protein SEC61 subunit gamma and related proteins
MSKLKEFVGECVRVIKVTKKPDQLEYTTIMKVSALGIAVIGLIGFLITITALMLRGV